LSDEFACKINKNSANKQYKYKKKQERIGGSDKTARVFEKTAVIFGKTTAVFEKKRGLRLINAATLQGRNVNFMLMPHCIAITIKIMLYLCGTIKTSQPLDCNANEKS